MASMAIGNDWMTDEFSMPANDYKLAGIKHRRAELMRTGDSD
jgi:hypothetical protein